MWRLALPAPGSLLLNDNSPRIGLFWVAPNASGVWAVHDVAHPTPEVPAIGGFRTLELGHAEAWPRLRGSLSPDYGDYPRGRVNWRAQDDRYLLLLDPVLLRGRWREGIAARFRLPTGRTLTLTDPHYRSRHRPPAEA